MTLDEQTIIDFKECVWQRGRELYRDMPWRDDTSFYSVLVSEIMLQQTQVSRVLEKYHQCMQQFPTIDALASADLSDVLVMWQGLGYNRRGKFLHQAAQYIAKNGIPSTVDQCVALPGVGKNTAGALMAYVYNQPICYVETNIRTVYFYHFFRSSGVDVSDSLIVELLEQTIDREHPRQWYWALMDYGSDLKRSGKGYNTLSKHYKKQSPLKGSVREVRGQIMTILATDVRIACNVLEERYKTDDRYQKAISGLVDDGLVARVDQYYQLTK